jgi:nucleoside-diphosphate-sugar epimerase
MVIGNGLLGKIFKTIDSEEYLIFSSGVSNSMEKNEEEYNREFNLIKNYINTDKKFIYFSTININDDDRMYFLHKRKIEKFIINSCNNYLIFRLPNIIGNGGNVNNIFNYFKTKIIEKSVIKVQNVNRSLIDIDDVKKICERCLDIKNTILHISHIESTKVIDIVNIISSELNKKVKIKLVDGVCITNSNSQQVDDAIKFLRIDKESYTKKIIKKYIKQW